MNLYLLRHGRAEKQSILYPSDHQRPLTPEAEADLRRMARRLPYAIGRFDQIRVSPLLRARQTAEIVSGAFGPEEAVEPIVDEDLAGEEPPEVFVSTLGNAPPEASVLAVSHAPFLDDLLRYLVAPQESAPFTRMPAGCMARVEFDPPLLRKCVLHWIVPLQIW